MGHDTKSGVQAGCLVASVKDVAAENARDAAQLQSPTRIEALRSMNDARCRDLLRELSRESDRDRTRNDDDLVRTYRTEHLRKLIERLDRGLVLERCRGQAEPDHTTGPQRPHITPQPRPPRPIA